MPHVQHGPFAYFGSKFLLSQILGSPLHCNCFNSDRALLFTYPMDADKSEFMLDPGIIISLSGNLQDVDVEILIGCNLVKILSMRLFHRELAENTKFCLAKSSFTKGMCRRFELQCLEAVKSTKTGFGTWYFRILNSSTKL